MRFVFFLGPGGVGKTTVSAGVSLELAKRGKKTLVITIDPAKRLKSALGIPIDGVREITKNLWATQVNKKDEFVRFAREKGLSELTETKLFEIASDMLPSEEYSAFLKIVELSRDDFDFVVVDTPPSSKFLSFLDAPVKILSMFETNSVRYFIEIAGRAGEIAGRAGVRISGPLSLAGRILGGEFITEFAKFLAKMRSIFGEMQEISRKAERIIMSTDTLLFGITSPAPEKVNELLFMADEVEKKRGKKRRINGVIINRFLDFSPQGIHPNAPDDVRGFHEKLVSISQKMRNEIKKVEAKYPVFVVEEYFHDVSSVELLVDFAKKTGLGKFVDEFIL